MGFSPPIWASSSCRAAWRCGELFAEFLERIDRYHETRDFPAVKGRLPERASAFRHRVDTELAGSAGSVSWPADAGAGPSGGRELIWRDFDLQVLRPPPAKGRGQSFKPEYEGIKWEHGKQADPHFKAWCEGRTGYPLMDAAMMQINQTGYMHNRLRMVVASFLTRTWASTGGAARAISRPT